jgi:SHS2 domain-containing protein
MEKFEFIDITTADVAFIAYGKNLDELFSNAALAMFEIMINTKQIKPKVKKKVRTNGNDLESLMFNWLNALLVYVDGSNLVFNKFKVKVNEKRLSLTAECRGEKIDSKKHEIRTVVKAATYHKLEVKKVDDYWRAKVIIDI